MSRQWWTFWRDDFGRWLATPREDIDLKALDAERAYLAQIHPAAENFVRPDVICE